MGLSCGCCALQWPVGPAARAQGGLASGAGLALLLSSHLPVEPPWRPITTTAMTPLTLRGPLAT